MEAVAKHILSSKRGIDSKQTNFPVLMGQAFTKLGLITSATKQQPNEPAQYRVDRVIFELACSINSLRNKQGTGHRRPVP